MLNDQPISPTIPAADLDRAKRFYQDTLGLKVVEERDEGIKFESGESVFFLYPTPYAGSAQHTQATWTVSDLDETMADLRGRGVEFEEYDLPGLKTVNGVAETETERGAWFKDTEGNILAVSQDKKA
ncbi:MAG: VOC family protein [Catenulispora sp.]|nr:VOC family protein [Catenulispora sp.]